MPGIKDNNIGWSNISPLELIYAKSQYEEAVTKLQHQCSIITERMRQIETQIVIQNKIPVAQPVTVKLHSLQPSNTSTESVISAELNNKFNEIQNVLDSFRNTFLPDYSSNPIAQASATTINSAAKGYLSRKRKREFLTSLLQWRVNSVS